MRVARERIIFLALCVLDEAASKCGKEPVPKTLALRLALAYLASVSDKPRESFDQFWHEATRWPKSGVDSYADGIARSQTLNMHFNGICRSVGMERTVALMHRMRKVRKG